MINNDKIDNDHEATFRAWNEKWEILKVDKKGRRPDQEQRRTAINDTNQYTYVVDV